MRNNGCKVYAFLLFSISVCFVIANWSGAAHAKSPQVSYESLKNKYVPQSTPEASYRLELELLSQGMYCYDLPLFDMKWRQKGRNILYNPRYKSTAQKFNVQSKTYREGRYAVVYFPYNKAAGPEFLYNHGQGWVIDRTAVWEYIHYNYSNTGWFAYNGNYPYLKILKKIFPLEKVRLDSGHWAYRIREKRK